MADKKINVQVLIAVAVVIVIIAIIGIVVLNNNGSGSGGSGAATATPSPSSSQASVTAVPTTSPNAFTIPYTIGTAANYPRTEDLPYFATVLGYYPDINAQYVGAGSGAATLTALESGSVNFAMVSYLTLTRAIAAGDKNVITVASYHGSLSSNFEWWVLNSSGIKSPADLKGKRVDFIKGSSSELFLELYLKEANLTTNDVVQVNIPTGSEYAALESGQVDAVFVIGELENDMMGANPGIRLLFSQTDVTPPQLFHCGLVTTKSFLAAHPKEAQEFIDAYVKAADWARDNYQAQLNLSVQEDIALGDSNVVPYIYQTSPDDIATHALANASDIQWFIDELIATGELKPGQITASDEYTNQYNPYYNSTK